ncbi:hypothetical protein, partial [Listeria monocytogenes]
NEGLKTTYYVRSNDIDVEECEWWIILSFHCKLNVIKQIKKG